MEEPIENLGAICKTHAQQRLEEWQNNHKGTVINSGDYVKTEFKDPSVKESEHMWVYVYEVLPDGTMLGTLDNDPFKITNYKCGDQVTVERSLISDHIPE